MQKQVGNNVPPGATAELSLEAEHEHQEWCPRLDRRAALRMLGLSAVAAATGCGSGGTVGASSTSTGTTATTTSLAASPTSVAEGASVKLTATVLPSAATGTVTFYDASTSLGSAALSAGSAAMTTSFSATGTQALTAAYSGSDAYAASTSAVVDVAVTAATSTCATATLEGEEGPYFIDDSASGYLRSDIVANLDGSDVQTGIPLTLTVYVYDSENSCAAMQGVQVDIWHCSASGIYSAESSESTVGQSWLRGYQITDSYGKVSFTTILPGWYSGRTTHIHLRLRSTYDETDDSGSNTMQLFFDQTLIDTLATSVAPYSAEGTNATTNASDRVYSQQEDGTTLLTLTGSNMAGYTASFNVYLPI